MHAVVAAASRDEAAAASRRLQESDAYDAAYALNSAAEWRAIGLPVDAPLRSAAARKAASSELLPARRKGT